MKKLLCSVLILMLTITALPVWANDEILDNALFYAEPTFSAANGEKIDTVTAGKIACRYVITNRAGEETSVTVLMGMYDGNVLKDLDAVTKSVEKEETKVWETAVTATDANSVIRLFVAESGHPVRLAAVLNNKSRNCEVKSFSLGEYAGEVNNDSGRIDLRVPNTLDLTTATPTAVLADTDAEAEYDGTDFSETVTMTVTAANGAEKTYRIYTTTYSAEFKLDFESDTVGEKPVGWTTTGGETCPVTVENDPAGGENKVLKLNDTSTGGRAEAAYEFADMPVPFKVSYKVRYGHGTDTYNASGSAVKYYWTSVDHRDAGETITKGHDNGALSNISAWETGNTTRPAVWQYEYKSATTGNKIQYPSDKQLSSVNTNHNLNLDTWYNVEIEYFKDGYMTYSVNGTQLTRILMIHDEQTANQFYATTRAANTGYMYLDDITFTPLKVEEPTNIDMNFDEATEGALTELEGFVISEGSNASIVSQSEGKALQLDDTTLTAALSGLEGEAELSFDLTLPNKGDSLTAKVGDLETVTFAADENGKLWIYYETTSGDDKTVTTEAAADEANAVRVLNCYGENAGKRMIMIFVKGELIAVYAPSSENDALSEISLTTPPNNTAVIDNLKVH